MKKICYLLLTLCILTLHWCSRNYSQSISNNQTGSIISGSVITGSQNSEISVVTPHLKGSGTEPFWGFELSGTQLTRMEPDNISASWWIITTSYSSVSLLSQSGNQETYSNSGAVLLQITFWSCSDGMSDIVYTWNVVATISGNIYTGCVNII